MDQERIYLLALHFIPGLGDFLIKQLISYCGSAEEVFKQNKRHLLKIPGVGEMTTESIHKANCFSAAEAEFRRAEKDGIQILFFTDKSYPLRLKNIEDSPSLLYVKGNTNLNHPRTIGIVGTRNCTAYGRETVERLVHDAVPYSVLVVSGLAYGIDILAHREALKHGLPTLAVLGSGLDVIYPSAHLETANKIVNQGALITENHFGTKPDAHHFPERNRIIAGLSDALVVVEAAEKGGALITAEIANSYNKDVFAIPGNLDRVFSTGCNKLIKINKASLLTSAKDLEYIMNWGVGNQQGSTQLALDLSNLEPDEQTILRVLREKKRPTSMDELCSLTGIQQGLLSSVLLSLEFKNIIVSLPGKLYRER